MLIQAKVLLVDVFDFNDKNTGDARHGCTLTVTIGNDPINFRIAAFGNQFAKASSMKPGDQIQLEIRPDRNLAPVIRLA